MCVVVKRPLSDLLLLCFSVLYFFFGKELQIRSQKSFPQKCPSVHIVVFIYGSLFAWVLKIEVINHRNHYFMDKCNYELASEGGRAKRQHCKCTTASGKPHFNNIIKFLLILFLSRTLFFAILPRFCEPSIRLTERYPTRKFNFMKCILPSHNPENGRKMALIFT